MATASGRAQMLGGLYASHLGTLTEIPGVVSEQAGRYGWSEVLLYLADIQETVLSLLTGEGPGRRPGRPGTSRRDPDRGHGAGPGLPARRDPAHLRAPGPVVGARAERHRARRADADHHSGLGRGTMEAMRELAGLVALLLVAKRGTSDAYARLVRRRRMNVSAEMEWRLMPPRTFATDRVVISALMEPAYEVSGDAFDYELRRRGRPPVHHRRDGSRHRRRADREPGGRRLPQPPAAGKRPGGDGEGGGEGARRAVRSTAATPPASSPTSTCRRAAHLDQPGHQPPVVIRGGRSPSPWSARPRRRWAPAWGSAGRLPGATGARGPRCCSTPTASPRRATPSASSSVSIASPIPHPSPRRRAARPETLRRLIRHHLEYHRRTARRRRDGAGDGVARARPVPTGRGRGAGRPARGSHAGRPGPALPLTRCVRR